MNNGQRIPVPLIGQNPPGVYHLPYPVTGAAGGPVLQTPNGLVMLIAGGTPILLDTAAKVAGGMAANLEMEPQDVAERAMLIARGLCEHFTGKVNGEQA